MTLQTRLGSLITAVGADIKELYSRLPGGTTENSVSGTTHAFALADAKRWTVFTSGSAVSANIPLDSSVSWPVGTELNFRQSGAGPVTITVTSGTRTSRGARYTTNGAGAVAAAKKISANTWLLYGDLVA